MTIHKRMWVTRAVYAEHVSICRAALFRGLQNATQVPSPKRGCDPEWALGRGSFQRESRRPKREAETAW